MTYNRPVFLIGNGARGCDFAPLLSFGVPILSSWMAADLIDNDHYLYFGRSGIYGQRAANKILNAADCVIAIGNRCSIWNIGYEGFREGVHHVMVDVDEKEARKFPEAEWMDMTAEQFIHEHKSVSPRNVQGWLDQCDKWRKMYPWTEKALENDRYISPYTFMERLQPLLKPDQIIVADVGTANVCANQVLRLKPPQRLMSSGGLGEMGCALPAAIGASFARNKGEVLCLQCDGSMMMNLQELQTIKHHKLPIKIIVFSNNGYAMIRRSQDVMGLEHTGISPGTGVSFPSFRQLAHAWGYAACDVRTWKDFDKAIPALMAVDVPALVEVFTDPEQVFLKLNPVRGEDGSISSPAFDQLSPIL